MFFQVRAELDRRSAQLSAQHRAQNETAAALEEQRQQLKEFELKCQAKTQVLFECDGHSALSVDLRQFLLFRPFDKN
jgi:hypothetical protein